MRHGLHATGEQPPASERDEARPARAQRHAIVFRFLGMLLVLGVAACVSWNVLPVTAEEDQWLEWVQVVLLLATSLLHARAAGRSAWPAVVHLGLGILTLSFAVREVDIDHLGPGRGWLLAERAIRAGVGVLWLWWGWRTWRGARAVRALWPGVLREPWLHLTLIGGALYMGSWMMDREMLPLAKDLGRFVEEVLELQADAALLVAALVMRRR